ncbi:hypothetical protein [Embleya sp. NPDC001921]
MTATTTDLRSLTQIRWETRLAAAGLHAVSAAQRAVDAARVAEILHAGTDANAYIEAATVADEWALIADERAGRRAAA